ncbi:UDP-glucose flavonoid 3-O-glucosyltransferase 7-like [Arachis ipaensis]|uniref:Glycosyltransferase n=1 Tax=Arachis hypogaea TaxID=3818 RepID=A0A444X3Q0_ARAHY|nr:UDP-glucose flavonoid 3-O-glucosyltransferase 7-like [Arachis ipaensis]QHN82334.1 Scopoletin glucosyltransferase [Arachis hypogaea]RYQ84212.1 hypothetical protein Ahy_B10g103260 [Arachis hypogaea]
MGSEARELHVFFFPFPAQGHIIPTIDVAKLFTSHGATATIITTPSIKPLISQTLQNTNIHIKTIKFPSAEFGLPDGCEKIDSSLNPNLFPNFLKATMNLQEPLEQLLLQEKPQCLVADMFFPWATEAAAKFGIPRLVFHGTSLFALSASLCVTTYEPYNNVSSDTEAFVIPNLPGDITMVKKQLTELSRKENNQDLTLAILLKDSRESEMKSYGVLANSFQELESPYINHYVNVFGRRVWCIGPVSLCNRSNEEKALRGVHGDEENDRCLKWLSLKKPNSVVYISFGSVGVLPDTQLKEIAIGLEASGREFIWVVKRCKKYTEEWNAEEFEKRMEGKGLIIRDWAPQVLILEHEAVGAFVTHCGWNSTLESVTAGVPMVTWPLGAEQFYNEKLVTDVLEIGVPVGTRLGDCVDKGAIESALKRVMVGEEANGFRNRAKVLALKAKKAVEVGESSYSDLNSLILKLQSHVGNESCFINL